MIENKKGTIQLSIMDETDSVTDVDEYIADIEKYYGASGITMGEVEDVTLLDCPMKHFSISLTADDELLRKLAVISQTLNPA